MKEANKKDSYENLWINSNFMFTKLMSFPDLCQRFIEILLGIEIEKIEYIQEEKGIDLAYHGKSVRLDVFVKGDGKLFNLEMQVSDEKNIECRMRYYQGIMDLSTLKKGQDYVLLPETYVIFICTFDPFACGLPRYTFEQTCREKPELKLKDGSTKVVFNATAAEKEEKEDLRAILHLVMGETVSNSFVEQLLDGMIRVKTNEKWRKEFMVLTKEEQVRFKEEGREEGRVEGREEGRVEGRAEGKVEGRAEGRVEGIEIGKDQLGGYIIKNLLAMFDDVEISRLTGWSVESINKIRREEEKS